MAESDIVIILNERMISCPICLEVLQDNRDLPCGHTICLDCLKDITSKNDFKCPVCRTDFKLPSSGKLEDLHENFTLKDLLKSGSRSPRLSPKRMSPESRASQGNESSSISMKELAGSLHSSKDVRVMEMCMLHDQPIQFFCKTCESDVCHECVIKIHRVTTHDVIDMNTMNNMKIKQKFNCLLEDKKRLDLKTAMLQEHLNKKLELIESEENEIIGRIQRRAEDLMEDIKRRERSLTEQTKTHYQQIRRGLQKMKAQNDYLQDQSLSAEMKIKILLQNTNNNLEVVPGESFQVIQNDLSQIEKQVSNLGEELSNINRRLDLIEKPKEIGILERISNIAGVTWLSHEHLLIACDNRFDDKVLQMFCIKRGNLSKIMSTLESSPSSMIAPVILSPYSITSSNFSFVVIAVGHEVFKMSITKGDLGMKCLNVLDLALPDGAFISAISYHLDDGFFVITSQSYTVYSFDNNGMISSTFPLQSPAVKSVLCISSFLTDKMVFYDKTANALGQIDFTQASEPKMKFCRIGAPFINADRDRAIQHNARSLMSDEQILNSISDRVFSIPSSYQPKIVTSCGLKTWICLWVASTTQDGPIDSWIVALHDYYFNFKQEVAQGSCLMYGIPTGLSTWNKSIVVSFAGGLEVMEIPKASK